MGWMGQDEVKWDGTGQDGTGQGWPHALSCPNTQSHVPRAAASSRTCQKLCVSAASPVPVALGAAAWSPPLPGHSSSLHPSLPPSAAPHCPQLGRMRSLQLAAGQQGAGHTSNPFPYPFSLLFPPLSSRSSPLRLQAGSHSRWVGNVPCKPFPSSAATNNHSNQAAAAAFGFPSAPVRAARGLAACSGHAPAPAGLCARV